MAPSGVMVRKPSLRMRVAEGISIISRAGCMLGVSVAFKSKKRHARHRGESHEIFHIQPNYKINGKYRFVKFCISCVGRFFRTYLLVGVPVTSDARQSTQNHLANLTESAILAMNGCAVSYD